MERDVREGPRRRGSEVARVVLGLVADVAVVADLEVVDGVLRGVGVDRRPERRDELLEVGAAGGAERVERIDVHGHEGDRRRLDRVADPGVRDVVGAPCRAAFRRRRAPLPVSERRPPGDAPGQRTHVLRTSHTFQRLSVASESLSECPHSLQVSHQKPKSIRSLSRCPHTLGGSSSLFKGPLERKMDAFFVTYVIARALQSWKVPSKHPRVARRRTRRS